MTYKLTTTLQTPDGTYQDAGKTYEGRASVAIDEVVPANGGSANVVDATLVAADLKVIALKSSVPCVVTLTGHGAVTLESNTWSTLETLGGNVTGISIGANTVSSGPAGSVKIRALYDS